MGYRSLAECVNDLKRSGQLVEIDREVDPHLEVAAIQRRVYQAGGPALLFRFTERDLKKEDQDAHRVTRYVERDGAWTVRAGAA